MRTIFKTTKIFLKENKRKEKTNPNLLEGKRVKKNKNRGKRVVVWFHFNKR